VTNGPHQGTNWQDAFENVRTLNTGRVANLVVFVTDGDPNTINSGATGSTTSTPDGNVAVMTPAAAAADVVKGQGSRVFAIGVGPAVNNSNTADRLTAVSGDVQYSTPQPDFAQADFTLVSQFAGLEASLRSIVTAVCAPSVTITKWVRTPGEVNYTSDAPGWAFTGTLTATPGTHEWVEPDGGSTAATVIQTTDESGLAPFKWSLSDATATPRCR
jgi:hypothetical protein